MYRCGVASNLLKAPNVFKYVLQKQFITPDVVGQDSDVGITTRYWMEGPRVECRWG
jgi:hypothetical protein